jgi:hypothetical protein
MNPSDKRIRRRVLAAKPSGEDTEREDRAMSSGVDQPANGAQKLDRAVAACKKAT